MPTGGAAELGAAQLRAELRRFVAVRHRLEADLQAAYDASHLPMEPTSVADLQAFVVQTRLDLEPALTTP